MRKLPAHRRCRRRRAEETSDENEIHMDVCLLSEGRFDRQRYV